MLVYIFFIKLADDVPPEDAIELYFKKVSDYFTIATNYSCKVDFDKQKIKVDANFFPFIRTGINTRHPEKAERFPFGLKLEVKKENILHIKASFQLLPTLTFYLLSIFCALLLVLYRSNGTFNGGFLNAILFFVCTISFIMISIIYFKGKSIMNLLGNLYSA